MVVNSAKFAGRIGTECIALFPISPASDIKTGAERLGTRLVDILGR